MFWLTTRVVGGTDATQEGTIQPPPLDPDVADRAPCDQVLTDYDRTHLITYLRLLDAERDGADWREVARIVLHIDPAREGDRAHTAWQTHLNRAHWMQAGGYRHLLNDIKQ